MTISRQIRIQTSLLQSAKKAASFYNASTNEILCDAIRRGLLSYSLLGYSKMKTTHDLRVLERKLNALSDFFIQDLQRLKGVPVEDYTESERANGLDDDDDFLTEDVDPDTLNYFSNLDDAELVGMVRDTPTTWDELESILPSDDEIAKMLDELLPDDDQAARELDGLLRSIGDGLT